MRTYVELFTEYCGLMVGIPLLVFTATGHIFEFLGYDLDDKINLGLMIVMLFPYVVWYLKTVERMFWSDYAATKHNKAVSAWMERFNK